MRNSRLKLFTIRGVTGREVVMRRHGSYAVSQIGRSIENTDPFPGVLSNVNVQPIASLKLFESANPRPVPSIPVASDVESVERNKESLGQFGTDT